MGNERVVVQITIVANSDGQSVLKTVVGENEGGAAGGATGGSGQGGGGRCCCTCGGGTGTQLGKAPAQRTVHIVAGTGGLAWFTTVWPAPVVVTNYQQQFSFDDPAQAALVPGSGADHPLYTRRIDARYLWDGRGAYNQPTIFVAGSNQAHTAVPNTTTLVGGIEVVAAGAALQAGLGATIPALAFKSGLVFGPATGAPPVTAVNGVAGAIAALKAVIPLSIEDEQDLVPSAAQLAKCSVDGSTPVTLATLANLLLFTVNAFRRNFVSTVLIPAFNDDPHGAFAAGNSLVASRTQSLTAILDGFYALLAAHPEPKAQDGPLSLADNVVLVVSGDTPKNPFDRNGWSDGTPGGSNLLYVRSNGYLKPGWFGSLTPSNVRTNFDPVTGLTMSAAQPAGANAAALLGVLFAIGRGNTAAVAAASPAPYNGVVSASLP